MRIKIIHAAVIVLCLGGGGYTSSLLLETGQAGEEKADALLRLSGALRVFVVDALWIRMSAHYREGKESLVLSDARTLLRLAPENARIRYFLHWHLCFNMARKASDEAAREEWYREGLEIMEQGLAVDPDSPELNRGMGMTFYIRSEVPGVGTFNNLCLERYGRHPEQLAHVHFKKAYDALEDRITLLFFMSSLFKAARFEMKEKHYGDAARHWKSVLDYLAPWLEPTAHTSDEMEFDPEEARQHYTKLHQYCALMDALTTGRDISAENREKLRELERSIKQNRDFDLPDEQEQQ